MPSTELLDDPLLTSVPLTEGYKVLGGVALYQKLGQGGMGAVYKGRHVRLDIDVALKVMVPPAGISPERADVYVKRFIREARTAAKIDHPNLIRVTDVNAESGVYFLVMQFVDGESAAERLKRKGPLSEAEAVQIVLGAAEGLARAHQTGIVHRDVKPDNIMIDCEGGVKVADLGLAKAFQQDDDGGQSMLTQTQHALGTPSYMPPEQFISARSVGPPGDVWALGITLFELLTGQLPWTGSSVFVLGQKITGEPLPDIKTFKPDLSDGVCALIERATQKNPGDRYAHCGEMIGALRDHQHSVAQPVVSLDDFSAEDFPRGAPQVSPPPENTLSTILVLLEDQSVEPTPAVESKSNAPLTETISVEEALRDKQVEDAVLDNNITTAVKRVRDLAGVTAVAAKAAVESLAEQLNAVSARTEVKVQRSSGVQRSSDVQRSSSSALPPAAVHPTPATVHHVARKSSAFSWVVPTILFLVLVATAWYLLDQLLQKQPRKAEETQIQEEEEAKRKAAKQKAAKQKAVEQKRTAEEDRKRREAEKERARRAEADRWKRFVTLRTLTGHTHSVRSAAFSPDGKWIVTASFDETARVWDVATETLLHTLSGHTDRVNSAAFSPDGKWIVTASRDKTARVWESATGTEVRTLSGHTGWVYSAAFSPDGKWIVTASQDKTARVWESATGTEVRTLSGHTGYVYSAAFSPDGKRMVTASADKTARVWDAVEGTLLHTLSEHTSPVRSAAFSPDGKWIVTASTDKTARVWDAAAGTVLHTLSGHESFVQSAAFSPDGKRIVTASSDKTARVWGDPEDR